MKKKHRYSSSQLFNFATDSYLERTSRPIYAVIFLLPFIVFYELGTILINTDVLNHSQVRVVAFVWLQNFLEYLGIGSKLAWAAPPLVVVVILLSMQLVCRKPWRFFTRDIWPMAVECILLAVPLIVLSLLLNTSIAPPGPQMQKNAFVASANYSSVANAGLPEGDVAGSPEPEGTPKRRTILADIVTGIGAGIYEELIFRLILICALMMLFQDVLRIEHRKSIILSVLISAALFSAHHHIDFLGGSLGLTVPFNWTEFGFRTIAGVYFAVLFAIRGFGITAGAHGFYDIIAVLINARFFPH